jgi:outer membrane protein
MINSPGRCMALCLSVAVAISAAMARAGNATDVTLETCIREALDANPGARAAALRVDAARAAQKQARSAYYPRLSAAASYTMTDNPPQAFMMELNQRRLDMRSPGFDPNEPSDTENVRLSLALKYRLYDGQRGANSAMARLGERMAVHQDRAARNALIHEVTRGYYRALQAQAFVAVRKQSLKSLEENLRVARERFEAGSAVKTDVLNLDVRTAQAKEDLIRARNGVKLAVAALNTAIGKDLISADGLAPPQALKLADLPDIADGARLVQLRPEYQFADLMARVAELTLKKSRGSRGPVVNAYGSVDWDGEDLSEQEQSYLAGLALEWEWFTGFENRAAVARANKEWEAARQELDQVSNELKLDLRRALLTAGEARERLDVMRKSVDSAEEALRITRERYREGSADITVLLMSEVGLTATRTRETAATYDYLVALSNVDRACGELVNRYNEEGKTP